MVTRLRKKYLIAQKTKELQRLIEEFEATEKEYPRQPQIRQLVKKCLE